MQPSSPTAKELHALSLSSHSSLFVSFILFSHFFFLYVAFHISLSLAPLSCLWFVQTLFIFLSYYFTLLFSLNPSLLVRFFISSLFWPSISPHFFLSFQPLFHLTLILRRPDSRFIPGTRQGSILMSRCRLDSSTRDVFAKNLSRNVREENCGKWKNWKNLWRFKKVIKG